MELNLVLLRGGLSPHWRVSRAALLDAMIRHAVENGKQTLCIMRTALAVTKGYLANRETVLTRARLRVAHRRSPVPKRRTEAVETYANFVGGYLNAARWGAERLERDFETNAPWMMKRSKIGCPISIGEKKGDLSRRRIDATIVEAFGFSTRGNHPLFPFNKGAIRQLVLRRKFLTARRL